MEAAAMEVAVNVVTAEEAAAQQHLRQLQETLVVCAAGAGLVAKGVDQQGGISLVGRVHAVLVLVDPPWALLEVLTSRPGTAPEGRRLEAIQADLTEATAGRAVLDTAVQQLQRMLEVEAEHHRHRSSPAAPAAPATRCAQETCSSPASVTMQWPGRAPSPICQEHLKRARGIAGAMGFELPTAELGRPK